jgi:hypothetical protein
MQSQKPPNYFDWTSFYRTLERKRNRNYFNEFVAEGPKHRDKDDINLLMKYLKHINPI